MTDARKINTKCDVEVQERSFECIYIYMPHREIQLDVHRCFLIIDQIREPSDCSWWSWWWVWVEVLGGGSGGREGEEED